MKTILVLPGVYPKQLTATEILLETVAYYRKNKRGIDKAGSCVYISKEGHMCGVGRCMVNPSDVNGGEIGYLVSSGLVNMEQDIKPEYHGQDISFWRDLQMFHDRNHNWKKKLIFKGNRLTEEGNAHLDSLLERYK